MAYLEDALSYDLRANPKRFWSYIKNRKQGSFQIVTLRSKDEFLQRDTSRIAAVLNEQLF